MPKTACCVGLQSSKPLSFRLSMSSSGPSQYLRWCVFLTYFCPYFCSNNVLCIIQKSKTQSALVYNTRLLSNVSRAAVGPTSARGLPCSHTATTRCPPTLHRSEAHNLPPLLIHQADLEFHLNSHNSVMHARQLRWTTNGSPHTPTSSQSTWVSHRRPLCPRRHTCTTLSISDRGPTKS